MEAFSLLKYWRPGRAGPPDSTAGRGSSGANTVLTAVTHNALDSDSDDNDDGPFFDLEFAVPDEYDDDDNVSNCAEDGDGSKQNDASDSDGAGSDEEREFDFDLSSSRSGNDDRTDPNPISLSPSDDLFFDAKVEPNPKFAVSFLRSATRLRGLMLGFKKTKQSSVVKTEPGAEETERKEKKLFTVKFVEDFPIMSLFTREPNTSLNKALGPSPAVPQKQIIFSEEPIASDEKRFSKDVMQKYLRKVKPLYVRVSRRYGEKLRFSGQLALGSAAKSVQPSSETEVQKPSPPLEPGSEKTTQPVEAAEPVAPPGNAKSQKQGNFPAGFRVVCKHLGKSLSAVASPAPAGAVASRRRDDSLLQQQDGIQSAILHCKRSFNASRDSESSSSGCENDSKPDGEKSRMSFEEDGA